MVLAAPGAPRPPPPLPPLVWAGGQRAAPGRWWGSPGDVVAHLAHVPDAKVTRDVRQLQLGQLLLQDLDPQLVGCRGRGRASPPALPAGAGNAHRAHSRRVKEIAQAMPWLLSSSQAAVKANLGAQSP